MLTSDERYAAAAETGAGLMRNRCAFTSRDMGAGWPESFTYGIVLGWDDEPGDDDPDGAMREQAAKWGWDADLIAFLRDAHERFKALADRLSPAKHGEDGAS